MPSKIQTSFGEEVELIAVNSVISPVSSRTKILFQEADSVA